MKILLMAIAILSLTACATQSGSVPAYANAQTKMECSMMAAGSTSVSMATGVNAANNPKYGAVENQIHSVQASHCR
ncbi:MULTISPECIES: hypothetical protein [unclassified Acinetobacter]|uniref:hypothetical protein n=1 Tax=unclassified Acinetobacter TaxID=196816 RepID=UPI0035BB0D22